MKPHLPYHLLQTPAHTTAVRTSRLWVIWVGVGELLRQVLAAATAEIQAQVVEREAKCAAHAMCGQPVGLDSVALSVGVGPVEKAVGEQFLEVGYAAQVAE